MSGLSAEERSRLAAFRAASSLGALVDVVDAADEHEAYFEAKAEWRRLRGLELGEAQPAEAGVPGATVTVGRRRFHVHGVTHADTAAERAFLREHVREYLEAGHVVYCEQGIRGMYFRDFAGACAMDDYRWALRECERRGFESHVDGDAFDSLAEGVGDLASEFQEAAFALVEASGDRFGRRFEEALGAVASEFLRSHADHATASDFASFRLRERAAADPSTLWRLQRYYECAFLPQPLEREWLRRHDPELELVTHARNARMADYAVYHADGTATTTAGSAGGTDGTATTVTGSAGGTDGTATTTAGSAGGADGSAVAGGDVHLVVGAAHQPGVRYYLERHRDGDRTLDAFEPVLA